MTKLPRKISEDTENGWECPNGCAYSSAWDAFHGMLGFCGCGSPHESVGLILDQLMEVNQGLVSGYDTPWRLFMRYWLDEKKWTEHGCGIGQGWLSDDGKAVMAFLAEHEPKDG